MVYKKEMKAKHRNFIENIVEKHNSALDGTEEEKEGRLTPRKAKYQVYKGKK